MGCGSVKQVGFNQSNSQFIKERNLYTIRQKELNLLGPDVLSECMKKGDYSENGINEIYKEILNTKKLSGKLNEVELKKGIQEFYVEQEILKEDVILKYDIQEKVSEKLSSYSNKLIEKYTKEGIQVVYKKLFESYPKEQSGFLLTGNPSNMLGNNISEPFYNVLKFHDKLKVQCLVFIIDNSQINDTNHLQKIAEVIACNDNLKTLCVILKNDIPLSYNLDHFNKLFDAIRDHINLQSLVLLAESSENKLKLNSYQEDNLLSLFNHNSKLNAFILGKFIVSQSFLQNLGKVIPNNTNLKAFSFIANSEDSIKDNNNILNELIDGGVAKSNSLIAVLIAGFDVLDKDRYETLEKTKSNLNILQIVDNFDYEI